jgi:putative component of toxin-antitoxin plasmid stabilization module
VKNSVEITFTSIHVGGAREVVALAFDGKSPAVKFLTRLKKNDSNAYSSLKTRIKTVAGYKHYENDESFRHVGDGVYEFKRNNPRLLRLYAFYDEIDGIGCLILCTNGGDKTSQAQDILKAKTIKERYFAAKKDPETTFNRQEPRS